MRHTLEQLKAMNAEELGRLWCAGAFPFEWLPCGGGCLTMHERGCREHPEITANIKPLQVHGPNAKMPEFSRNLRAHLEELYALRLFYDHLYPQPEPAEKLEQLVESDRDWSANTRE